MKGPYRYSVQLGATAEGGVERVKRIAIRRMRQRVKRLGLITVATDNGGYEYGARGEVRDRDGALVKQQEAYRTKWGAVKLRDLEL